MGETLSEVLAGRTIGLAPKLLDSRRRLRDHDQCLREDRRITRVEMAIRLVRWLESRQTADAEPETLDEAVAKHVHSGSFVDWARWSLRCGDPVRELSEAYAKLFDIVSAIQEVNSHRFARLLVDWTAMGSASRELIHQKKY